MNMISSAVMRFSLRTDVRFSLFERKFASVLVKENCNDEVLDDYQNLKDVSSNFLFLPMHSTLEGRCCSGTRYNGNALQRNELDRE